MTTASGLIMIRFREIIFRIKLEEIEVVTQDLPYNSKSASTGM